MRIASIATLLLAAAASAGEMTFEQASALATKDSATLSIDQMASLADSQEKASRAVRAKCPEPVKKADYAPFTVVMEVDATGRITRTWLQGSTAVATCFNEGMKAQTLAKPPHAPFYASYNMNYQQ